MMHQDSLEPAAICYQLNYLILKVGNLVNNQLRPAFLLDDSNSWLDFITTFEAANQELVKNLTVMVNSLASQSVILLRL